MLIYDPTAGIMRDAADYTVVADTPVCVLEGVTGDCFKWNKQTNESGPVIDAAHAEAVSSPCSVTEGANDKNILRAVFVTGSGGAGKGRIAATMFAGEGLKYINQDTHLEKYMKAESVPLSHVGQRYDLLKKAQRLKNAEVRQYGSRRLGLIVDSTGWEYDRIATPAKKLRNLGYDVYMVFVTTSLETALARNKARADAGGRHVPASYVKQAHEGAHANLAAYKTLLGAGNVVVIANDNNFSQKYWDKTIAPKLQSVTRKWLQKPLANPIGIAWAKQQAGKTTDTVSPATEWPIPPPSPVPSVVYQPKNFQVSHKTAPSMVEGGDDIVSMPIDQLLTLADCAPTA